MVCHMAFSVLVSFYPQAAAARGISEVTVGWIFSTFAIASFFAAPFVRAPLRRYGRRNCYAAGLLLVSLASGAFAIAHRVQDNACYILLCLLLRALQGLGAAFAETAAYALIAAVDRDSLSFNLGMTEVSTGLGYMLGPVIGGLLFDRGGFELPFVCMSAGLFLASLFAMGSLPVDRSPAPRQELRPGGKPASGFAAKRVLGALRTGVRNAFEPMAQLLGSAQIGAVALSGLVSTCGFAFLEPTLGAHVSEFAASPLQVGALFAIPSFAYMLCSGPAGWLCSESRWGTLF
ncbi:major facilitator superfamily domain-containing protein [Pavlovales sp. CCMP2436]|nr:major facilitator superfamily domain-containing protein [Pavlovales sp. CCMP2436]